MHQPVISATISYLHIIGFDSEIIFRVVVKGHMAHVNKKSSQYEKYNVYL